MIAAALRLADILDFDRERTPRVLFHYLFPDALSADDSSAVLEWRKHMAISNWNIEEKEVVFRGRCTDHVVHHGIVLFAAEIEREIATTRATFGTDGTPWPFRLPSFVKTDIHEEGYRYVPYRLELDDERIYSLLMGGAIYDNPLVAVRELLQNAVDACKLRDALTQLNEPYVSLSSADRIVVRYEEPDFENALPRLVVIDTGVGMDAFIIEKYFLRVGQSYYRSAEFNHDRVKLRSRNLDFAPVSDFGIGFLSCFLLADRVKLETAMWEPQRGDSRRRTLLIDGPSRLIRLNEDENQGAGRLKGTRVTLYLSRGGKVSPSDKPPTCEDVLCYIEEVCEDLPYRLTFEHVRSGALAQQYIAPKPMAVGVPPPLEGSALRIQVAEKELEGEIVLVHPDDAAEMERQHSAKVRVSGEDSWIAAHSPMSRRDSESVLLRGGFRIGGVPGLPHSFLSRQVSKARLRLAWTERDERRFASTNLARTAPAEGRVLAAEVTRVWLRYLLEHVDEMRDGQLRLIECWADFRGQKWLERWDAYTVYRLARTGWHYRARLEKPASDPVVEWEEGRRQSLRLGLFRDELYWRLLDLILPRITKLQMEPEARFLVSAPRPDWRDILSQCFDYITAPISWGPFVEYIGSIADILAYDYPGVQQLNSRFQDRLPWLNEEEARRLTGAAYEVASARRNERQPQLTRSQAELFKRAAEACPDGLIGGPDGAWRLDSFEV